MIQTRFILSLLVLTFSTFASAQQATSQISNTVTPSPQASLGTLDSIDRALLGALPVGITVVYRAAEEPVFRSGWSGGFEYSAASTGLRTRLADSREEYEASLKEEIDHFELRRRDLIRVTVSFMDIPSETAIENHLMYNTSDFVRALIKAYGEKVETSREAGTKLALNLRRIKVHFYLQGDGPAEFSPYMNRKDGTLVVRAPILDVIDAGETYRDFYWSQEVVDYIFAKIEN